jgi:hypothetical protein
LGTAGFEETQVFCGDLSVTGKIKLTKAPPLAPLADLMPNWAGGEAHAKIIPRRMLSHQINAALI